MHVHNQLLGSTAVVSTTMLLLSGAPDAAEVKPGGALNLSIKGFARFEAGGGEQNDLISTTASPAASTSSTTPRCMSLPRAGASKPGSSMVPRSSSWRIPTRPQHRRDLGFLKGGWGEVRMGDQDGVVENSIVGGQTIAVGTGGIDGSDFVILPVVGEAVFPTRTEDATKIRYYTPSFGGFSLGVSSPHAVQPRQRRQQRPVHRAQKRRQAMQAENIVEGGLIYDGDVVGIGLEPLLSASMASSRTVARQISAAATGTVESTVPRSTFRASSWPAASAPTRLATRITSS